jgi:probable HAF family extracellular repeat protein
LPGGDVRADPRDISADGSVVVGWSDTDLGDEAFIWTAADGMRKLQDVLIDDYGLADSLTGWKLSYAYAVSSDGRVFVGSGINPAGKFEAWIAKVPEPSSTLLFGMGSAWLLAWKRRA